MERQEGQRILVTRDFSKRDIIGYLQLRPGVEIPPDVYFALGYTIVEKTGNVATKIHVHEVSMVRAPAFLKDGK